MSRRKPSDFAVARCGNKFVVARAGKSYYVQARNPNSGLGLVVKIRDLEKEGFT
jgi:hypothetical protein